MLRLKRRSHLADRGSPSIDMDRTLQIDQNLHKRKLSLLWGTINIIFLGLFIYDLSYKCPIYTTWFNYCEYFAVIIFSLNTLYHTFKYIYYTIKTDTITVNQTQMKLLAMRSDDPHIKVQDEKLLSPQKTMQDHSTPNNTFNTSLQNMSHNFTNSWKSNSNSPNSPNYSLSSPSWTYFRGSPDVKTKSPNVTPKKLSYVDTSAVDFIADQKSLKQYLDDFEYYEKAINASNPQDQTINLLSSFWSHPTAQNPNEMSPFLKKMQYQLATQTTGNIKNPNTSGAVEDKTVNVSSTGVDVWKKLQIQPHTLIQWNSNLRMWISQTILDRLVSEINFVNDEFVKYHLHDVKIGCVGLERLRKTAQTIHVAKNIPTLATLLPFLEASPNQEYLVKRVKELARGGCMSDFKWNSGGMYNDRDWDDSLVNDSEMIMHLLASYLDCQLLPLPNQPEAKPFSKEHFIRHNEKIPHSPLTLAIHQVIEKPPHFRLIVGEEVFEIAKGHNNLFYTILLFLYFVNKKEHGMLGKVNMGRSGVNMLWIIEEN